MTDLFVNFPQIYCSKHPAYLLSMVCRHPNCKNKGAICCRCQLKSHNGDGHNLESFIPLDEVLQLCENQNPKAEYFEDLSVNGLLEIQQISTLLPKVNTSIHKQLERELLLLGQFQKPFKDLFGLIANYTQIDGNTTRTDDGYEGGMKSDFLNLMKYIAEKIILIDGEYILDQSDMNECLTEIIERKKKNLGLLTKLNKHSQKQIKIIEALFNTGCSYGIDYRIPIQQFNNWTQIYSVQYYEVSTYEEIKLLPIPKKCLVMIGTVKEQLLEVIAIDKSKAIFDGKYNSDSKLQWKFNNEQLSCQCISWEFNKQPLQQQQLEQNEYLYHLNDRRVIYYLQL